MSEEINPEEIIPTNARCTCPTLINGHLPNCPYLKKSAENEEYFRDLEDAEYSSDLDYEYDEHGDDGYLDEEYPPDYEDPDNRD